MARPVVIVPYAPAWPAVFGRLRDELVAGLGALARDVIHVGRTAVPGLAAKPVIDIDMVIAAPADLGAVIGRLAEMGYVHEGEQGIAGRHAFAQPARLPRHHLYVCEAENPELMRHIAFRDLLRGDPQAARAYGALKSRLAARFGSDREGYSAAKSAFIEDLLSRACRR